MTNCQYTLAHKKLKNSMTRNREKTDEDINLIISHKAGNKFALNPGF